MNRILLKNIYYCQNKDVTEYMDIFFETNLGILKNKITSIGFIDPFNLRTINRLEELDLFREKYGNLYIDEVRITYDNNMYILISEKFILAIEYVLNTYSKHSVQEFRIIDNIDSSNKIELDEFKELDIVKLPNFF
jgi:hypothetical protein